MKFKVAAAVLKLLSPDQSGALTCREIAQLWEREYGEKIKIRNIQNYMTELADVSTEGLALVNIEKSGKEHRYYLRMTEVAHWFMTAQAALTRSLTFQILKDTFGELGDIQRQRGIAEHLVEGNPWTRRLSARVRVVSDGIGRLRARIAPSVLGAVMDAIGCGQLIRVDYLSAAGNASHRVLIPLGLVAKDGSLYLLAVEGLSDAPVAYPLHRMQSALVVPQSAQERPDFDLDRFIEATHQLSHGLTSDHTPVDITLKVHPRWLYHFQERPLSADQQIVEPAALGEWATLRVCLPITVQLKPFLASMGPGVEVLEPPSLRQAVGDWLTQAASAYAAPG